MTRTRSTAEASRERPLRAAAVSSLTRIPRGPRLALYMVAFLGVVGVGLPWAADRLARIALPWGVEIGAWRAVGWVLTGAAWIGYLGSTVWLVRHAPGANVEFDPPQRLVSSGPYRCCRNPMASSFVLMLLGLALSFSSIGVFVLFLVAVPVAHAQVVLLEEPLLRRRFGAAYERYVTEVSRWVPRPCSKDSRWPSP